MKIGELSRRSGLSIDALRFYERRGLLKPVARLGTGEHRIYGEDAIERLSAIREYRSLGLTLKAIRRALDGEEALRDELEAALKWTEAELAVLRRRRKAIRDRLGE